jgi:hypothetical protein
MSYGAKGRRPCVYKDRTILDCQLHATAIRRLDSLEKAKSTYSRRDLLRPEAEISGILKRWVRAFCIAGSVFGRFPPRRERG